MVIPCSVPFTFPKHWCDVCSFPAHWTMPVLMDDWCISLLINCLAVGESGLLLCWCVICQVGG